MGLGIMQGRLGPPENGRFQCFPRSTWREEFPLAAMAGLTAIEWIWDAYGADLNPLATESGHAELLALSKKHGVAVRSICADYFMDFPLVRTSGQELAERKAALQWLISTAGKLFIERIVIPFVDVSRIESPSDLSQVVHLLTDLLPAAEGAGVELHIEADLAPVAFAEFLSMLPHTMVKVNYDSGNSSSLRYHPTDEFAAYGGRIGSVHIKDRVINGGTVALGTGDTDFLALVSALQSYAYSGDFVLQVARGKAGDEVEWARRNRQFAELRGLVGPR